PELHWDSFGMCANARISAHIGAALGAPYTHAREKRRLPKALAAAPQTSPGAGKRLGDASPARDLPVGQPTGDEGCCRYLVEDGCGPEVLLGNRSVLVLAEQVLHGPRMLEEPSAARRTGARRSELGGVAGALELDSKRVHRPVLGTLAETPDGLRKLPE